MDNKECRTCRPTPENAENSVKCKQCGNMVSVAGESSSEGMVSCPMCGSMVSVRDTLDTEVSNEDY